MAISTILGALKYIPASLGVKALAKFNPKFKNFFTEAASYGYDANQALDYLHNKFSNPVAKDYKNQLESDAQAGTLRPDEKEARSSIARGEAPGKLLRSALGFGGSALSGLMGKEEQVLSNEPSPSQESQSQHPGGFLEFIKQNPELGSYLDSLMQQGLNPVQAASEARKKRKFAPIIEKIENQIGQSFEDLLGQLFQGSEKPSDQRSQGRATNQTSQGFDQSGGDSELIAALQQILKM